VAASIGRPGLIVCTIEKLEGGFSKGLLLRKDDGSELVAKFPFFVASPPKYTTASEVAVLQFRKTQRFTPAITLDLLTSLCSSFTHTQVPVSRVLACNADRSNPVGAEYIMMEKVLDIQLFKVWDDMSGWDKSCLIKHVTKLEGEITAIRLPASGSL
jgi:hypothetical protein